MKIKNLFRNFLIKLDLYNTKRRIKWLKKNEEEIKKFGYKDQMKLVKDFFTKNIWDANSMKLIKIAR